MARIKNVALAAASGNVGGRVFEKLNTDSAFNVTVLRRPASKSTFPGGTHIIDVDYEDVSALTKALSGQDALVISVPFGVGTSQLSLIDAAAAAGVHRTIPCFYGPPITNPLVRESFIYADQAEALDRVREHARARGTTYSELYTSNFIDWSIESGFIFNVNDPFIIDDGNKPFSATTVDTVAEGIVGILRNPEETKNRSLQIEDFKMTQNRLLELAQEAVPDRDWGARKLILADMLTVAQEQLSQGAIRPETVSTFIYNILLNPQHGCLFEATNNQLLGLKPKGEEVLVSLIKKLCGNI